MTLTPEDQRMVVDALATMAECQLKIIHWKAELAAQIVRIHHLEGEISRTYRALSDLVRRQGVSGANPG